VFPAALQGCTAIPPSNAQAVIALAVFVQVPLYVPCAARLITFINQHVLCHVHLEHILLEVFVQPVRINAGIVQVPLNAHSAFRPITFHNQAV